MKPLVTWSLEARRQLLGVFTDIDDTLTTGGAITPDALRALADLKTAGLQVIAITGRPIGWCEPFARGDAVAGIAPWPLDAIVAENGAVAFAWQSPGKLSKIYLQTEAARISNFARMNQVAAEVLLKVPGTFLSQDSPGRETDIAIDHSEFTLLPPDQITQVVQHMQNAGMTATVSSIHINGWFGDNDKLEGARWIVRALFDRSLDKEIDHWAYVGDSTNDQIMFQHFKNSIGVANICRFGAELSHPPCFVTPSERGAGFAEVARTILQARSL